MNRIKYEVELSALLDKTVFIDKQEHFRANEDLMNGD